MNDLNSKANFYASPSKSHDTNYGADDTQKNPRALISTLLRSITSILRWIISTLRWIISILLKLIMSILVRPIMSILSKTFGGLDSGYYLKHLIIIVFIIELTIIGFAHLIYYTSTDLLDSPSEFVIRVISIFTLKNIISILLYPYARFTYYLIYYSIMNFIFKDTVVFLSLPIHIFLRLFGKPITELIAIVICLFFTTYIAPIGLIYLYFSNRD